MLFPLIQSLSRLTFLRPSVRKALHLLVLNYRELFGLPSCSCPNSCDIPTSQSIPSLNFDPLQIQPHNKAISLSIILGAVLLSLALSESISGSLVSQTKGKFHCLIHWPWKSFCLLHGIKPCNWGLTGKERERLVTFRLVVIFVSFSSFFQQLI